MDCLIKFGRGLDLTIFTPKTNVTIVITRTEKLARVISLVSLMKSNTPKTRDSTLIIVIKHSKKDRLEKISRYGDQDLLDFCNDIKALTNLYKA